MNWQPIASKNFPTRTANACRKRHERLMERRNVEDWDGEKLEMLGREYMEVRREMWGLLAARLGERWAVIEAKVSSTYSTSSLSDTANRDHSAWRKDSRTSRMPHALHTREPQRMMPPLTTEVTMTTRAIPA